MPDAEVSRTLKPFLHHIKKRRRELNASTFSRSLQWTREEDSLLGTMPDQQVARKLNRSLTSVRKRRRHLNIQSWRSHLLDA